MNQHQLLLLQHQKKLSFPLVGSSIMLSNLKFYNTIHFTKFFTKLDASVIKYLIVT